MNRALVTVSILVGVTLIGAAGYSVWTLTNDEELSNKPEWSALQYAELDSRNKEPPAQSVVRTVGSEQEYRLLGVRSVTGKTTVWVLLNPKHPPFYKQLPATDSFVLSQDGLTRIVSEGRPHPEVKAKLQQSMSR